MRIPAIIIITMLMAGAVQAQIQKGDVQLSGNVFWRVEDQALVDVSYLTLRPSAGLFLSDKTSLGLMLGFRNYSREFDLGSPTELDENSFQYGIYTRFHKNLGEKFYFFLQPSVMLGSGETKSDDITVRETNTFEIGLAPGLTYFLNDKWALEVIIAGLHYDRIKSDENGTEQTVTGFDLSLNLANVGFGLSFYIR